jgi:hypothetical protein
MRAYRWWLSGAALYNVGFGIWAGLFPHSFFQLFRLDTPRYPSIWACLGMVIGLYALAYAAVAWRPERGDLLVLIGLLGKVLGPAGWLIAVRSGELPPRTFPLILANDLIWWFPFVFYLLRHRPERRAIVAWMTAAVHVLACGLLLGSASGTEAMPEIGQRLQWIQEHAGLWASTWLVWSVASMSLLAFCIAWGSFVIERGGPRLWVALACLIVALGLVFDLAGENVILIAPTLPGQSPEGFAPAARLYALLSAATANGLYCVGGLMLSAFSWRIGWLRGWLGMLGFVLWVVGLSLTAAAILGQEPAMVVAGGGVMALFIPWTAFVGGRWFRLQADIERCCQVAP